jgi:hypothetical protein
LGDWAVAGGNRGGGLVVADLLVFIRMLIFLTADFGFATKQLVDTTKRQKWTDPIVA